MSRPRKMCGCGPARYTSSISLLSKQLLLDIARVVERLIVEFIAECVEVLLALLHGVLSRSTGLGWSE